MKKLIIFLMIATVTANAGVIRIYKGSVAPYTGSLVDSKTMGKIRVELIEKDAYRVENRSLTRSVKLHQLNATLSEKQVNMLTKSNENLANRLEKTTDLSSLERVLWFGLGVVATGFAFKGAKELTK